MASLESLNFTKSILGLCSREICKLDLHKIFPGVHLWQLGRGARVANGPCFLTAYKLDRRVATKLIDRFISSSAIQTSSTQPPLLNQESRFVSLVGFIALLLGS